MASDSRRFDFRESRHVSAADLNHVWQLAVVVLFYLDLLGDFFFLVCVCGGGGEPLLNVNWVMYERPSDAACEEEK